jgi:hypothetical protein
MKLRANFNIAVRRWLFGILGGLTFALLLAPASQATVTITSLIYFHPTTVPDCEDTISLSACAPVGVTVAGATNNPFLNDLATKAINIGPGHYYTFGNPYAGTDFMIKGDSLTAQLTLSNGATLTQTVLVPNLSTAGVMMFDFADGISIFTTGITGADRMSFGNPPGAFAPDGNPDYVLQLAFVPEPANWTLMLMGFGAVGAVLRGRRRTVFTV